MLHRHHYVAIPGYVSGGKATGKVRRYTTGGRAQIHTQAASMGKHVKFDYQIAQPVPVGYPFLSGHTCRQAPEQP